MILRIHISSPCFHPVIFLIILSIITVSVAKCNECINKIPGGNLAPGLCVSLQNNNAVKVKLDLSSSDADDLGRTHDHGMDKKPNLLQRFGALIMMIPLVVQILSLPGAIASIKMSLLKSLFVGKLALIVMLYNLLRTLRPSAQVVVVHPAPVHEHVDHYYSPMEENEGWFF